MVQRPSTPTPPARDAQHRGRAGGSWSPVDFDHEQLRVHAPDAEVNQISRSVARTVYVGAGGSGTADLVRLDGDALASVINCVLPCMARWDYDADEPHIMLRASLSCDVVFRVEGAAPMVFNRPEVTLVCMPEGLPLTVDIVGGARQQGIVAVFRARTFGARYGLGADELPAVVLDALRGSGAVGRIASFPIDHRIAALVADTIDSRLHGELRAVQVAGRVAELVAYTLDAIRHTPTLRGVSLQSRRDLDFAYAALHRLERDYRTPPLFAELARDLRTNQNKLKVVFKEAFGVTMADYCLGRRMREAQQLLLEATLTIAQVAERVGYGHQSSFTAAFRGHVGMSPREYRRHRAPFTAPLGLADDGAAPSS